MTAIKNWKYLAPKEGSAYRQLFIKGTRIMARILYGMHVRDEDPMTAEEIAAAFLLPVEAVEEAIAYCRTAPPEIRQDWEREEANITKRSRPAAPLPHHPGSHHHETVP